MNGPTCSFYAIGDDEKNVYLRVHYFDGQVHYRFDAEHILDARLFKNRIECIECYAALTEMNHPAKFRIYAFSCTSLKTFDV